MVVAVKYYTTYITVIIVITNKELLLTVLLLCKWNSGINFADMMVFQDLYDINPSPPCVLGYEVAGVVDELGEDVTEPPVCITSTCLIEH